MNPIRFSSKKVCPATITGRLWQTGCRSLHRVCGVPYIIADQVGSYRQRGLGLVTQLVYTRRAICDVGVPHGSRTWHIARFIKHSGGSGGNAR